MQKRNVYLMSFLAVLFLSYTALALDSAPDLQCGQDIVSIGETQFDVREKCGEPSSINQGSDYGSEVWIYNFGPTEFVYYLTFVSGSLERIEVDGYGE